MKKFYMKRKHTFLTGIAARALVFITFLAGCSSFLPGLFPDSGSGGNSSATPADTGSAIPNGTYTFYPRLQATRGGVEISSYLDRIVVEGQYLNVYVTSKAEGLGSSSSVYQDASWGYAILQDLDNPSKIYNKSNSVEQDGFAVVTYQGVRTRHFGLTIKDNNRPPTVFEEIVLGEPDPADTRPTIPNGTYTFYPRLQATRGGVEISSYLDRIVVRGNYLNVYVTSKAEGGGSSSSVYQDASWGNALLQDLDWPSKIYNKFNSVEQDGFAVVTYEGVKARRFKLYIVDGNRPETVYDEIILGEPDAQ
jgi:hypothetical protein